MKALVAYPGQRGRVELKEVERPSPKEGEALLRVLRVGIDGTDMEIVEGGYGEPPMGQDYLILGHECVGEVAEIGGRGGGPLEEGWLVVPTVRRPDGCPNCRKGEPDMCLYGQYKEHGIKGLHGFASEYALSEVEFLVRVPKGVEGVAILLEPLSIAEKALAQSFSIQKRLHWEPQRALVLGAGALGLLATFLLRLRGLEVRAVATRSRESLKARLVEKVGGSYTNAKEVPLADLGEFDLILEATGSPQVAVEASRLLRPNGVLCLLGIYSSREVSWDMGRLYTSMVLGNRLIFGSVNSNKRHFEEGLRHLQEIRERFPGALEALITSVLRPEEYERAFRPGPEEIKTVIEFQE